MEAGGDARFQTIGAGGGDGRILDPNAALTGIENGETTRGKTVEKSGDKDIRARPERFDKEARAIVEGKAGRFFTGPARKELESILGALKVAGAPIHFNTPTGRTESAYPATLLTGRCRFLECCAQAAVSSATKAVRQLKSGQQNRGHNGMTISSDANRWSYVGDGSTTSFDYGNKIFAETDLKVYVGGAIQTVNTNYTVSGVGSEAGGSVVLAVAPQAAASVVLVRDVPKTQGTDLPFGGVFPAGAVEDVFDKITVLVQQNSDRVDRALVLGDSDPGSMGTMPLLSTFYDKYVAFDDSGNPTPGVSLTNQSVTYTADTFSGDNSTVAFTLSAAPGSTNSTSVFISGLRQVPGTGYSVSGTTLSFTSAPPTGTNNIFVLSSQSFEAAPGDGSVTENKLAADAVDWDAKVKVATAGDTPYWDALGNPARLPKGTDGQVWTLSSGIPSWANSAGGDFISGDKMLFQQTTAPTGWTKETTHNDKALRVVTGTPGAGGTTAFSTIMGSGKVTGSTAPGIGSHTHSTPIGLSGSGTTQFNGSGFSSTSSTSGSAGSGSSHTHTVSLDIQYVDLIICRKD